MVKSFDKLPLLKGTVRSYRASIGIAKPRTPVKRSPSVTKSSVSERELLVKETNKRIDQSIQKMLRHNERGVNLLGSSQYNPVSRKLPEHMNMKELRGYKERLDSFMSRNKQYDADAFGNPIPKAAMREYKMYERKYNAHINKELSKISGIKLPHMDMTLGERMDKVVGKGTKHNMTNGMNRLSEVNRNSEAFFSAEALKKAVRNMQKKLSKEYKSRTADANRNSWNALTEYSNRPELVKLSRQLTDEEFQTLADYSPLFTEAASNYSVWKKMQSDSQNASDFAGEVDDLYSMIEDQMRHIIETRING